MSHCPVCARAGDVRELRRHMCVRQGRAMPTPAPGDLTVCIDCASPLSFGPKLELFELVDFDGLSVETRSGIEQTIKAVQQFRNAGRA